MIRKLLFLVCALWYLMAFTQSHLIPMPQVVSKSADEWVKPKGVNESTHGFQAVPQVDYVSVRSSDGRYHSVPVKWNRYDPVVGNGSIIISEDLSDIMETDPTKRADAIDAKKRALGDNSFYRRHITSSLGCLSSDMV